MAKVYEVERGDCLSSIAARNGFARWQTIYEHPDNAEFRELRPNPNIIYAGDRLVIPDPEIKQVEIATGASHSLRVDSAQIMLRIELFDVGEDGLADASYELRVDGDEEPLTGELDGGLLEHPVPAKARRAHLLLMNKDSQAPIAEFELQLGELDPHDTLSGMQARLTALGYDCGDIDGRWGPRTHAALTAFRRAEQLVDSDKPYGSASCDAIRDRLGY